MNGSAVATSSRSFAGAAAHAHTHAHGKRQRPPTLSLSTTAMRPPPPKTILELETPVDDPLVLAGSPDASSPYVSALSALSPFHEADLRRHAPQLSGDLSKDLAVLEQLRRSVQKNLLLRPISRSSPTSSQPPSRPLSISSTWSDYQTPSPTSASSSVYFTPISDRSPLSAHFLGHAASSDLLPNSPKPPPLALDPAAIARRMSAPIHPILIDTRPVGPYIAFHIKGSINLSIPSLILKRTRQPGRGFQGLDALRQYITTEECRRRWDELVRPASEWDGDVVVFDDDMDESERDNVQATAWALLPVVAPLLLHGSVDYIKGGMNAVRIHPDMKLFIVEGDSHKTPLPKRGVTLPMLNTADASKVGKPLPEIERSATASPISVSPAVMHPWATLADASPSPPPSQSTFQRRRPSQPTLTKLNTKSAERLTVSIPKQQPRVMPTKSATLAAPPGPWPPSPSPPALNLVYSNHVPTSPVPRPASSEHLAPPSPGLYAPQTPRTPLPSEPHTARQEDNPLSTEEPYPAFTVSTILPHFLFLGPEPTEEEHVRQLEAAGVKRILNLAIECDENDHELRLAERFERYSKIPMRDTVEEENIVRGVREACDILDDASLHSAPTYVHCKAGKSRSVTAVMAYLIHANHWTLSRAYTFVLERRRGISPNIGFVSELMNFEEQELGSKSVGVVKESPSDTPENGQTNYGQAVGARRPGHLRESLPPAFTLSADQVMTMGVGDVGQETEVKDASGRYRHARRAPVDENTLQPLRRVSKAGLESAWQAEFA
ncbi:hypothetical protein K488DRAFT_60598 [Vararia minispora EC-137]|uniref:Uncharacterized protein n=1 Tax=Vararia minispora EC-137 TaxID=1314806 RepID=A0ACB8Q7C2_9AGAM|nr:hypothetical protein K488DRAFT_60598 [Vararia minispora EC-137]